MILGSTAKTNIPLFLEFKTVSNRVILDLWGTH
jgi:hypothetical protein